jgi:hypothetical protein
MWFNIAATLGHDAAVKKRMDIETVLPHAEFLEGQRRAKVCMASNYQDCD